MKICPNKWSMSTKRQIIRENIQSIIINSIAQAFICSYNVSTYTYRMNE